MSDKTRRKFVTGQTQWPGGSQQHVGESLMENRWDTGKDYWNAFGLTRIKRTGSLVNARFGGDTEYTQIINAPGSFYWWAGAGASHLDIIEPSYSLLCAKLFSEANPSVPSLSLAAIVAEMRDIPEMFRLKGRSLLKKALNGYVGYEFAYATMYRDIKDLWDYTLSIDARVRTLNNLKNTGKTTEKRQLYKNTGTLAWQNQELSSVPYIQGTVMGFGKVKHWGAVQYELDQDFYDIKHLTDYGVRDLAESSGLGFYGLGQGGGPIAIASVADVWEVLPWSWFADYFANVGDVANMTDNRLGLKPVKACLMRRLDSTIYHLGGRKNDFPWWVGSVSSGTVERTEKSRSVADPHGFHLAMKPVEFLTGKQLGILSALTASSRLR